MRFDGFRPSMQSAILLTALAGLTACGEGGDSSGVIQLKLREIGGDR